MTDLPVPGTALDQEDDLVLVLPGGLDLVHDRVERDLLLVEEHEGGLVADDPGHVVEQALVRTKRGRRPRGPGSPRRRGR